MSECELQIFSDCAERKSKKDHPCCECNAKIKAGEVYLKIKGLWGDDFLTFKQHLLCARACEFIRDNFNGYECVPFGDLFEWFHSYKPTKETPEGRTFRKIMADIIRRERKS